MQMDNIYFALWYGPQYRFAYGIIENQSIEITWLEKIGVCNAEYSNLNNMFWDVAKHQGWNRIEGLAMTIVSEELYSEEMRILTTRN